MDSYCTNVVIVKDINGNSVFLPTYDNTKPFTESVIPRIGEALFIKDTLFRVCDVLYVTKSETLCDIPNIVTYIEVEAI